MKKEKKFNPPDFEKKICLTVDFLKKIHTVPRPLVFTNGCFDILHRGHVTYLSQAKQLGKSLVVALNTDESVKGLGKGSDRPINPLEDRLCLVAALESVDYVLHFEEATPFHLIQQIAPDVLVKGGDWQIENIVGAEEVLKNGGKVYSIPFSFQRSTTALLEKIRSL